MKSYPNNAIPQRSALDDYPGKIVPAQPTVSAIIPVYNELQYIGLVVDVLLKQDYPALTEIWFVDGRSSDGTFEELQTFLVHDPRLRVLTNTRRSQASAINMVFAQTQSDIVIRLDAHARYAPDVIRRSVEALLATGAGGVGAIARPMPAHTLIGQGIVAAHESKLGVGVAKFRQANAAGWVDTVWNGCYWKHVIDMVGPLREDLKRSEDNDFHARVRALGYGLYLSPKIEAYYYPRQSLLELWRQYLGNGIGVAQTFFENRQAVSLRHLVPLLFVVGILLPLSVSLIWPPALLIVAMLCAPYLCALVLFSFIAWRKKPGLYVVVLPFVFATLHISYGVGALAGIIQVTHRSFRRSFGLQPST